MPAPGFKLAIVGTFGNGGGVAAILAVSMTRWCTCEGEGDMLPLLSINWIVPKFNPCGCVSLVLPDESDCADGLGFVGPHCFYWMHSPPEWFFHPNNRLTFSRSPCLKWHFQITVRVLIKRFGDWQCSLCACAWFGCDRLCLGSFHAWSCVDDNAAGEWTGCHTLHTCIDARVHDRERDVFRRRPCKGNVDRKSDTSPLVHERANEHAVFGVNKNVHSTFFLSIYSAIPFSVNFAM